MNRRSQIFLSLLLCLPFVTANGFAIAAEATWQQLLKDGRAALEANDSRYAIYKLQNAWLAVPDRNLDSDAHQKVADAIADTYSKAGHHTGKQSTQELDRLIRQRFANRVIGQFDCELRADGTLAFFAHKDLYSPTAGYCATGSLQQSKSERDGIKQAAAAQAQHQKELMAKMPITFPPSSNKYAELLSLCQPLSIGQKVEIRFDLNPFLPQEFEIAELF